MNKLIEFDHIARAKLLNGIKKVADSVGATLGPLGHNVAIGNNWGTVPIILHDGVSVAKAINLKDPFENVGAQLVKESSIKTNDLTGDGTTTSTILVYAIVSEAMPHLENNVNSMVIRRELNEATKIVQEYIKSQTKPITSLEEKKTIATISAQDKEIGAIVAEAVDHVGPEGIVTVEDGSDRNITVEYREGMQFDRGYVSPYFITDITKEISTIEEPFILVTDHTITSSEDIMPLLESVLQRTRNLVIICDRLEGEALSTLISNRIRGILNVLPVHAPGFGEHKKQFMEDIASLVGANFIDKGIKKLNGITFEDLGHAQRVMSTADNTSIIGGVGDVKERVSFLRDKLNNTKNSYDKEKLLERISKLTSGVAVIKVGASTEVELKEKKERVIDSVAATKAAVEEGVIPGGATVLLRASNLLEDKKIGFRILKNALIKPFKRLMENSGIDYLEAMSQMRTAKETDGIDAMDGKLKNLIESGIVDPAKVVRLALESSVSIAGSVITTSVIIVDEPEDKKNEKP